MKTSAIIRIVVWSLVAVALIGLFVFLMGGFPDWVPADSGWTSFGGLFPIFSLNSGGFSYENADSYTVGGGSIPADGIRELAVNWVAGSVNVVLYDGDEIVFSEESTRPLSKKEQMRWLYEDGRLSLQFCAPRTSSFRLNGNMPGKQLTVKLPRGLAELESCALHTVSADLTAEGFRTDVLKLENVSGKLSLTDISCREASAETVSGRLETRNLTADTLDAETVSGSMLLDGSFGTLDCEGISGRIDITSARCPDRLTAETVSGDMTVGIPDNDGFTAGFGLTSGDFSCSGFAAESSRRQIVYKNGAAKFDFTSVSGNVQIEKLG